VHTEAVALYEETAEQKHVRLSSENNVRIELIKAEVEDVRTKNQLSHKSIQKLEKELSGLQVKQTKERPLEFVAKETKLRKGKKRQ
jgi:tetrahydromethanopterin S-methyltransferase subunit F